MVASLDIFRVAEGVLAGGRAGWRFDRAEQEQVHDNRFDVTPDIAIDPKGAPARQAYSSDRRRRQAVGPMDCRASLTSH
jgi:hypothetical protein